MQLGGSALPGHQCFRCLGCGALLSAASAPSACLHCGGALQSQTAPSLIHPHRWLPGLVDAVVAKAMLGAALSRHRVGEQPPTLSLVWLPWLVFDTVVDARYDGEVGHWVKHGDNDVLEWTPTAGEVQRHFEHKMRCASRSLPDGLAAGLKGFDWAFAADALGDAVVECTEIAPNQVMQFVLRDFAADVGRACEDNIGGDEARVHRIEHERHDDAIRLLLVPVWLGTLASGTRVAVNGRTGEAVVMGFGSEVDEDDCEAVALGGGRTMKLVVGVLVGVLVVAVLILKRLLS